MMTLEDDRSFHLLHNGCILVQPRPQVLIF